MDVDKEELAREVRTTARHFAAAVTEAQEAGLIVDIKFHREENERGQVGPQLKIGVDIKQSRDLGSR